MNVLDFGSGAGRDCFILSKLVGKDGFVTGVDMTEEQVHVDVKLLLFLQLPCMVSNTTHQVAFHPTILSI
jgi:tRNA A58 N-methylase Trm61